MKIEIDYAIELLEKAKNECLRPVDDSALLKDVNDKMFNFGVLHMFHTFLNGLYDAERAARGCSN